MSRSEAFTAMLRRVVERRQALLKSDGQLVYPALGQNWTPNFREQALCESFIVMFVAELETYIEFFVESALTLQSRIARASACSGAKPTSDLVKAFNEKATQWSKNNNTNWSRISEFILFIGLKKESFPDDFWDTVEQVANERGGIVHKSVGAHTMTDPRITIQRIEKLVRLLSIFDRDVSNWLNRMLVEATQLENTPVKFIAGMGHLDSSA